MNDELSFAKFMSDKRKILGITLRAMADILEIAPQYLSEIEKGRRYPPDMDKLKQIASTLKLTDNGKNIIRSCNLL
jgi:transcriptional regulator with XRE-family HTH domain